MRRTQIHLDERQLAALDRAVRETGASRSELIRRAIDAVYDNGGPRRLPRSIGSVSDGRLDASTIKQRIREQWIHDLRR
jgi:Arc/MetJ-type ribon-helix-helix transcriptional regulator